MERHASDRKPLLETENKVKIKLKSKSKYQQKNQRSNIGFINSETHQSLFNEEAEDDSVADFSESLEDLSPQIRVLDHIVELSVVIAEHSC